MLLFVNIFFLNLKKRNVLPNNFFLFLVFWKLFLKVEAKHVKYKNYYLKTSFKFNFLKIVFIIFLKTKIKILQPIRPTYPTNFKGQLLKTQLGRYEYTIFFNKFHSITLFPFVFLFISLSLIAPHTPKKKKKPYCMHLFIQLS